MKFFEPADPRETKLARRARVGNNAMKIFALSVAFVTVVILVLAFDENKGSGRNDVEQVQPIPLPPLLETSSIPEVPEMHFPPLSSIEVLRTNHHTGLGRESDSITVELVPNGDSNHGCIYKFEEGNTNSQLIDFVPIKDKRHIICLTGLDGNIYPVKVSVAVGDTNSWKEVNLLPFGDKKTLGYIVPKGDYLKVRVYCVPRGPIPQVLITTKIPPTSTTDEKK